MLLYSTPVKHFLWAHNYDSENISVSVKNKQYIKDEPPCEIAKIKC